MDCVHSGAVEFLDHNVDAVAPKIHCEPLFVVVVV